MAHTNNELKKIILDQVAIIVDSSERFGYFSNLPNDDPLKREIIEERNKHYKKLKRALDELS